MANGKRDGALQLSKHIGDVCVRLGRSSVETVTAGLLSLKHYGQKQRLPPIMDPLLLEPAAVLARKIRRGELSSVTVVKAYIQRVDEVDHLIKAVADARYSEALSEASKVDEFVKSGQKTEAEMERDTPLLGVPFSSKEACLVKGLSSAGGLVCRKGLKASEDCDVVRLLKKAGAIPLLVTNTSEICMWWETYNNVHGQTNNPYDTTKTIGGSSGGEAALIASGGSLIGVGTDLGGSIRIPCFFGGIFGHKPSSGLVPHSGQFPPVLKEVSPYVVTGPMTRYACDLRLMTSILAGPGNVSKLRINSQVPLQSIKVYYMLDDGGQPARTPVHPELKTHMQMVLSWLRRIGCTVQEVNIRNLKYGFMIWCSCLSRVKDQSIAELMSGEVKESVEPLYQEMWKWFSGKSDYTFPVILNACMQNYVAPLLATSLEVFFNRGIKLKREMDDLLKGSDSVFLYPTFPTPAQHHGHMLTTPMNVAYSVIFNTLGLPVTQCPLGLTSSGLPVGMQVVSSHGNDRLTLTLAENIEREFRGWVSP